MWLERLVVGHNDAEWLFFLGRLLPLRDIRTAVHHRHSWADWRRVHRLKGLDVRVLLNLESFVVLAHNFEKCVPRNIVKLFSLVVVPSSEWVRHFNCWQVGSYLPIWLHFNNALVVADRCVVKSFVISVCQEVVSTNTIRGVLLFRKLFTFSFLEMVDPAEHIWVQRRADKVSTAFEGLPGRKRLRAQVTALPVYKLVRLDQVLLVVSSDRLLFIRDRLGRRCLDVVDKRWQVVLVGHIGVDRLLWRLEILLLHRVQLVQVGLLVWHVVQHALGCQFGVYRVWLLSKSFTFWLLVWLWPGLIPGINAHDAIIIALHSYFALFEAFLGRRLSCLRSVKVTKSASSLIGRVCTGANG